MTRQRVGTLLNGLAALGFFGTAVLHGSGYASIAREAPQAPGTLGLVIPVLWLAFSVDLTVLGLILAVVAVRPGGQARTILGIASLCPFAAAGLQLRFMGFIPPTAILIGLGLLTLAGAAVLPPARLRPVGFVA